MNAKDIEAIVAALAPAVKQYVKSQVDAVKADIPTIDVEEMAVMAAKRVPAPKDGEDGKSVDQEALLAELRASMQEHFDSLPNPQDGKDADMTVVESMVQEKVTEQVASALAEIPKPKDGESVSPETVQEMVQAAVEQIEVVVPEPEHGRDALDLEILPTIDNEKSYPRGTYATYKGGLWRAHQQTTGMRGWEPIVNGVAETRIERADERTFRLHIAQSDGTEVTQDYRMPFGIFRGYYKDDQPYMDGDFVSRGGSVWCAKCDNPQTAPGMGNTEDWQLVVKKGRDGKNGGD